MSIFTELKVEQGSPEWLEIRKKRLGASEVPSLFEISPYETRLELAERKIFGFEKPVTPGKQTLFDIGHKAEVAAREWLNANALRVRPAVIVSNEYPDLLASLDGISDDGETIFEAKYIGREHVKAVVNGVVKPHHICQVQDQLLVSGAKKCIYFGLDPDGEAATTEIFPDTDYQNKIAMVGVAFMKACRSGELPEPGENDFHMIDDPRFLELADLKRLMDTSSKAFDEYKKELLAEYQSIRRIKSGGLKVTRSTRKGNIQYARIDVLNSVDLEKYRAKPSETVTVTFDKKAGLS